nr:unnamed protein product [Digitaria exilis]
MEHGCQEAAGARPPRGEEGDRAFSSSAAAPALSGRRDRPSAHLQALRDGMNIGKGNHAAPQPQCAGRRALFNAGTSTCTERTIQMPDQVSWGETDGWDADAPRHGVRVMRHVGAGQRGSGCPSVPAPARQELFPQ